MKKQLTLAANDFERYRKAIRREKFLAEMRTVVPWKELCPVISQSKVIHSVVMTPANTADCKVMDRLLLGHETLVGH